MSGNSDDSVTTKLMSKIPPLKKLREYEVDTKQMYLRFIEVHLYDALMSDKECKTAEEKHNKRSALAFFFASVGATAAYRNEILCDYLGFDDPYDCSKKIQSFIQSGATTKDLNKLKKVFEREARKLRGRSEKSTK